MFANFVCSIKATLALYAQRVIESRSVNAYYSYLCNSIKGDITIHLQVYLMRVIPVYGKKGEGNIETL